MTNNINGINGYGNAYSFGYVPQRNNNAGNEEGEQNNVQTETNQKTQVDPQKVMEFLANNNYFIGGTQTTSTGGVDAATEERIAGYMEQFEMIYGLVVEEFGEELAPAIMDLVMDKLIGA